MQARSFSLSLTRASSAMGSILHVAMALGVEPKQVYLWIAELDKPSEREIVELETRLVSAVAEYTRQRRNIGDWREAASA